MAFSTGSLFLSSGLASVFILVATMSSLYSISDAAPTDPVLQDQSADLPTSLLVADIQHKRAFVSEDKSNLIPGIVSETNDLMLQEVFGNGHSSLDKNSEEVVLHRVKRGRIKIRYNRNKDVVRDY